MENLIKNSIHLTDDMKVFWPQYGMGEMLDIADFKQEYDGAYSAYNSVICFVYGREAYVTPFTATAIYTIIETGLVHDSFHVPFADLDFPFEEAYRWAELCRKAGKSCLSDYEAGCVKWCKEHGIGKLDGDVLESCFRMPCGGVAAKRSHFVVMLFPVCNETCVDSYVTQKLGKYYTRDGRVVFVHYDGHTYVTKGYWIIDHLRQAGYELKPMFVPFSSGETIVDPNFAARWDRIPE